MPKMITGPAEPCTDWPRSRRRLLPAGHNRALYDSSRLLAGYRNAGQYPVSTNPWHRPPFYPAGSLRSVRHVGAGARRRRLLTLTSPRVLRVGKSPELLAAERALRLAHRRVDLATRRLEGV